VATTLGDLITQIRDRCDLYASQFVTDQEITTYINYSIGELYGLLVNSYGGTYFATSVVRNIASGAGEISSALPDDLYKVLGVDLQLSPSPSTNRITLQQFNFNERNRANATNMAGYATQYTTNYRYNIFNQTIKIQPPISSASELTIWYVPQAPKFVTTLPLNLSQTFTNNATLNGWLEYVTVDVSIKIKTKEETDTSMFVRQKAMLTERINNESQNRDIGSPTQVTDVYATGTVTDTGWNNFGDSSGWTY